MPLEYITINMEEDIRVSKKVAGVNTDSDMGNWVSGPSPTSSSRVEPPVQNSIPSFYFSVPTQKSRKRTEPPVESLGPDW